MPAEPIKCESWAQCRLANFEELTQMLETLREEKRQDNADIWKAINETTTSVGTLAVSVGTMTGKLIGFQLVGSLVVGIIAFVAAKVFH